MLVSRREADCLLATPTTKGASCARPPDRAFQNRARMIVSEGAGAILRGRKEA